MHSSSCASATSWTRESCTPPSLSWAVLTTVPSSMQGMGMSLPATYAQSWGDRQMWMPSYLQLTKTRTAALIMLNSTSCSRIHRCLCTMCVCGDDEGGEHFASLESNCLAIFGPEQACILLCKASRVFCWPSVSFCLLIECQADGDPLHMHFLNVVGLACMPWVQTQWTLSVSGHDILQHLIIHVTLVSLTWGCAYGAPAPMLCKLNQPHK